MPSQSEGQMSNTLLPPSATAQLRNVESATGEISRLPVELASLWDPENCPAEMLPYLAWALSVDRWDRTWPEDAKRAVIRGSFYIHRHKGTMTALRNLIEPLGYTMAVQEWWQNDDKPGTFTLTIDTTEIGITDDQYQELERLIAETKPVSRHLAGLNIRVRTNGKITAGVACYHGDMLTVYPYTAPEVTVGGEYYPVAAVHLIDSVRVTP